MVYGGLEGWKLCSRSQARDTRGHAIGDTGFEVSDRTFNRSRQDDFHYVFDMSIDTTNNDASSIASIADNVGRGLNYDFCPWFNKYVYWLKKPFGWMISGVFTLGLAGFLISPQAFAFMWALIGLIVVGVAWPWISMKGVTCVLKFNQSRSSENEPIIATLEIVNRWPVSIFGLMVEGQFLQEIFEDEDRIAAGLQRIPAWSTSKFNWEFEPRRRGVVPIDQPTLSNGFPFGISTSRKDIEVDGRTIVWPGSTNLEGFPEVQGAQFDIDGMMSDQSGYDGDVIGVRDFRHGDSLRHINWAKTATHRRLIVQERQVCAQRPMQVIIDLKSESHRGLEGQSSYEWAIRIAASICKQLHHYRAQVELICVGLPTNIACRASNHRGIGPLLDFLAMLPGFDRSSSESKTSVLPTQDNRPQATSKTKTIYVFTTRSNQSVPTKGSHSVVINADQFEHVSVGPKQEKIDDRSSSHVHADLIAISNPAQASQDLQQGWTRSCHAE